MKSLNHLHELLNILINTFEQERTDRQYINFMQWSVYTCMKSYNFVAHFISNPHKDVMVYMVYNGLQQYTYEVRNKIPLIYLIQ